MSQGLTVICVEWGSVKDFTMKLIWLGKIEGNNSGKEIV